MLSPAGTCFATILLVSEQPTWRMPYMEANQMLSPLSSHALCRDRNACHQHLYSCHQTLRSLAIVTRRRFPIRRTQLAKFSRKARAQRIAASMMEETSSMQHLSESFQSRHCICVVLGSKRQVPEPRSFFGPCLLLHLECCRSDRRHASDPDNLIEQGPF